MWEVVENESFRKMITLEEKVQCNFFRMKCTLKHRYNLR